ncbi:hypothetical protein AX15_003558 [Amanita polypyramis BW_CC]|nr:hypothetical protein AX15_003558 [Amanita polypyramis BW_CC]
MSSSNRTTVEPINSLADFQKIIKSGKPILIDFWAEWCGPCRFISPIFEKLSVSANDGVEFYKVDVDAQEEISQQVGIRAVNIFGSHTVLDA